jgi:hypothetical protein
MAEIHLVKMPGGTLKPANQVDADVLQKMKSGALVFADIKQPRNPLFHRKFFALLNFGFEYYNPPEVEYKGIKSVKSFEVFRKEVVIRAGYFTVTTDLKGNTRLEAESISFSNIDETRFAKIYSDVFNVIWVMVLSSVKDMTKEIVENTINQILSFD